MDKASFAGLLRSDLVRAGSNQKELAAFLKIRDDQVADWVNSTKAKPSEEQLDRLAEFFRIKSVPFPPERLNEYRACFDYPPIGVSP